MKRVKNRVRIRDRDGGGDEVGDEMRWDREEGDKMRWDEDKIGIR